MSYDIISFLDLAHSLRVWTEYKNSSEAGFENKVFKKSVLTKNYKKILRNGEYVYGYFPDGVTTSAGLNKGLLFKGPFKGIFSIGSLFKTEINGNLTISDFMMISKVLSEKDIKTLDKESKNVPILKVKFREYMESPAIYYKFDNTPSKSITVDELIKRVANEYDASHISSDNNQSEYRNQFSGLVKTLMEYTCAELPLPYFSLLHISKNIIDNFGKLAG